MCVTTVLSATVSRSAMPLIGQSLGHQHLPGLLRRPGHLVTQRGQRPLRSRAIVIGAAAYTDPGLEDLPSVRNNVADLAAILTSDRGTGLPAEHCTVVETDFGSLGDRVEKAVAEADDLLLFYYAGHGLIDSQGRLQLALPSTRVASLLWAALPFDTIRESLSGAKARNRVVILDCCYSGRAIGHMTGPTSAGSWTWTARTP